MAYSGKVAVLMGGAGSERDISLESGQNVLNALKNAGVNAFGIDITPEDLSKLDDKSIDIFFVMLHGTWGEDGQIQQILETKGLKFTGSGSKASKIAFDKIASKEAFVNAGIPTPYWISVNNNTDWQRLESSFASNADKFVVKPACEGSSVGIEIRTGKLAAIRGAKECVEKYGKTLIEEFIDAREITVGIVDNKPLPIIEIRPKSGFYDYTAKYIADDTEYLFDTIQDNTLISEIQACACECFEVLGCKGFARVDFMLKSDNSFYVLEINTIPGFTSHSLLPKAAMKQGITTEKLCKKILQTAL